MLVYYMSYYLRRVNRFIRIHSVEVHIHPVGKEAISLKLVVYTLYV